MIWRSLSEETARAGNTAGDPWTECGELGDSESLPAFTRLPCANRIAGWPRTQHRVRTLRIWLRWLMRFAPPGGAILIL